MLRAERTIFADFIIGSCIVGLAACATPGAPAPAQATPASPVAVESPQTAPSGLMDNARELTPDLFGPGVISTGHYELNAALTPDGKTVFFTVSPPNRQLHQYTIMMSRYRDGAWSQPEVAPFSGQFSDADPFVSADGKRVYYISRRPHGGKPAGRDYDLFYVERQAAGANDDGDGDGDGDGDDGGEPGWSQPVPLGAPINTDQDEYYISVTTDGTVYYSARYEGGVGNADIYRSRWQNGAYTRPEALPEPLNSKGPEFDPFVAPDESYVIFASRRPQLRPSVDLYISFQRDGTWTEPVSMGDRINSDAFEFCPIVSPDGQYFFFTSEKVPEQPTLDGPLSRDQILFRSHRIHNGLGNVYRVPVADIAAMRPPGAQ